MDPENETAEIAEVAEVIAEAATEIVAENNAAAERADAVNDAILEAAIQDVNRQRLEEIYRDFETRFSDLRNEIIPAIERLETCERTLAEAILTITALQATLVELKSPSSTQAPSNLPSEGGDDREILIVENPAEAETPPPSPPSEPPRPRVKRHLV